MTRQRRRARTGCQNGLLKPNLLFATFGLLHPQGLGIDKRCPTLNELDLTLTCQPTKTRRKLPDDLIFPTTHTIDIDLGSGEIHPPLGWLLGVLDNFSDVQQRFGWNTTSIQADTTRIFCCINQGYLQPEICSGEGRGVTAGPTTYDNDLCYILFCHAPHPSSANRNGSSKALAIQRTNRAPSAPSMIRWSYESESGSKLRGTHSPY